MMKELYANTWAALDQGVRIFLLAGAEKALVIDTGMTGLELDGMIRRCTDLPYEVLNTHADRDHIGGNARFDRFYMHPSEAAFYRNAQNGGGRLLSVFEGDVIDLGGRALEIVHLPGHTPGSITVLDRGSRCLVGGDPIQEDGHIFMFGPHRDMEAYAASLRRLSARDDFDCIYPSHGKEKVGRDVIPRLIEGAEGILAGTVRGEIQEAHGMRVRVCDAGPAKFLCAPE